ncbi:MAG: heat-inducible transcriptional repressor HrcA [Microbacteriaceae bacterium]
MVSERGLAVLRAIVQSYVSSKEPVASKSLVDAEQFRVSAATIRNEMAMLEEEELIVAPHTSSGRVPTDKGYRLFVDHIDELRPLSNAQKRAIETFLDQSVDLDDVLNRSVRLLSNLTNQVAMVQYPSLGISRVRHIELIQFDSQHVLIVLITDSGRVEQRTLKLGKPVDTELLTTLRQRINEKTIGQQLSEAIELLRDVVSEFPSADAELASIIVSSLIEQINANRREKLVVSGAANLAKSESDFSGSIGPILEAVEEQAMLLHLFSKLDYDIDGVTIRIGSENVNVDLAETSVVAGSYGLAGGQNAYLGVLGPTRMDYPGNFVAVQAVARYLSKLLGEH